MKTFALLLFISNVAVAAPMQLPVTAEQPPDVIVLACSWSKERLGWERDPFGGAVESVDEMRVRTRNERRIEDAKRGGIGAEVERVRREARADAEIIAAQRKKGPARYAFTYKASVKNSGAKLIKSLDWDYVFYDAATKEELGRHQFTSDARISPGKKKELTVFISRPPTRTISIHELNKKEREGLDGRVIIVRVVYADGSVWPRP